MPGNGLAMPGYYMCVCACVCVFVCVCVYLFIHLFHNSQKLCSASARSAQCALQSLRTLYWGRCSLIYFSLFLSLSLSLPANGNNNNNNNNNNNSNNNPLVTVLRTHVVHKILVVALIFPPCTGEVASCHLCGVGCYWCSWKSVRGLSRKWAMQQQQQQ